MARKRSLPKVLEPREVNQILDTIDLKTPTGKRDYLLYLLLWRTGMRIGEALYLRKDDFNLRTGRIKLPFEGKTGEAIIFAPVDAPRMRDAIDRYMEVRDEWDADDSNPYFFITRKNTQMDDEQVRQTLARRSVKAGLNKKVTPHMFRHTYATDMLKEGYSLREVQDVLRHADVSTTQIYTHLVPDHRERLMKGRTDF